jgi:antibiotic biosynthesis monooxygenase (ABM) superfamily enzyme
VTKFVFDAKRRMCMPEQKLKVGYGSYMGSSCVLSVSAEQAPSLRVYKFIVVFANQETLKLWLNNLNLLTLVSDSLGSGG